MGKRRQFQLGHLLSDDRLSPSPRWEPLPLHRQLSDLPFLSVRSTSPRRTPSKLHPSTPTWAHLSPDRQAFLGLCLPSSSICRPPPIRQQAPFIPSRLTSRSCKTCRPMELGVPAHLALDRRRPRCPPTCRNVSGRRGKTCSCWVTLRLSKPHTLRQPPPPPYLNRHPPVPPDPLRWKRQHLEHQVRVCLWPLTNGVPHPILHRRSNLHNLWSVRRPSRRPRNPYRPLHSNAKNWQSGSGRSGSGLTTSRRLIGRRRCVRPAQRPFRLKKPRPTPSPLQSNSPDRAVQHRNPQRCLLLSVLMSL